MDHRDQHVDRLLRDAMRGPVRAETADCLDIETLAAWSEGSLDAGARAHAEAHAAACTRCQSLLAAMIRTEPIVAAAASPSPFRKWLMILGPAMGAAAAVALWVAVDRPARDMTPAIGTPPSVQQQAAIGTSPDSPDSEESKKRAEPSARAAPNPSAAPTEIVSPRLREADKFFAVEPRAAKELEKRLDRLADAKAKPTAAPAKPELVARERVDIIAGMPAAPPPAPAPPPPATEPARSNERQFALGQTQAQTQSQTANQNVNQAQAETVLIPSTNANAAPAERRATDTAAGTPPSGAAIAGGRGGVARMQPYGGQEASGTFEVPTSNPLIRYRVLEGRTVQRTTDEGKTWATAWVVFAPATLRAGTAPAPTVCWLVGTNGLVLTTDNGVTWREAKLPDAVEIKSITAGDANAATVITADGRTFTTVNGGTSWSRPR